MIRPGDDYGGPATPPPNTVSVDSDAAAREVVLRAIVAGDVPPPLLLTGGDLHRTLGGRSDRHRSRVPQGIRVAVDLGIISSGVDRSVFVAHAALHNRRWRGRFAVAMNAQWLGRLDLGPRSHPGDGLLDITLGRLSPRERLLARRRARSGTHLPHPELKSLRVPAIEFHFDDPTWVELDGVRWRRVAHASVRVEPGGLEIHI